MSQSNGRVANPESRFAPWRVAVWMLLVLAAFGILQYSVHAWNVVQGLGRTLPEPVHERLRSALIMDVVYLLAACMTLFLAMATLRRRGWARPVLRIVVWVLALWFLVTAGLWMAHWSEFTRDSAALAAKSGMGDAAQAVLDRVRRSYAIGLALKLLAAVVLGWLGWRLGTGKVRSQFP